MVGTRGGPEERQTTANRGTIKRRKVLDLRPADILDLFCPPTTLFVAAGLGGAAPKTAFMGIIS